VPSNTPTSAATAASASSRPPAPPNPASPSTPPSITPSAPRCPPLHPAPKQTHFYSEDTPQQWLSIFSNPEILPLLPFRTVFLAHRVISSHPELAPAPATEPSPESPTV
jgi:hypothetical protein